MEFYCVSDYLELPVSYHAQKKRLLFYIDGELVYDLVAAVDQDRPDEKYYINMKRFRGKRICVTSEPEMELSWKRTDSCSDGKPDYCGAYRPIAHYTAKRGWLNDPNGLVYYRGKYLMFYQHNPVGWFWENMHWGYAVSEDLVHWEEKEIVLYPDADGTMFSGSAVVDKKNVTGLKENENDVILLFYTAAGSTSETSKEKPFTQCLAYSTDGGATFRKYAGNPLIGQSAPGNRDPKVIWHEESAQYVMALYLEQNEFALYVSKNLLAWKELQRITIPGETECPDFFPLAVDADEKRQKWVLIGASDQYLIGDFDGKRFVPTQEKRQLNYGNSSYAAQSWSNMPDGRRVRMSFYSGEELEEPFGSCMSVPTELSLKQIGDSIRLCAYPAEEVRALQEKKILPGNVTVDEKQPFEMPMDGKCYDISFRIRTEAAENAHVSWSLFGLELRYDVNDGTISCMGKTIPAETAKNVLELRIIIDTICAEIYIDGGSVFAGMYYFQEFRQNKMKIEAVGAAAEIEEMTVARLAPFWNDTLNSGMR